MGEAKRRGDDAARKQSAIERQNAVAADLIQRGGAPHYAFILDRSKIGREMLRGLKEGPPELRARATSAAVQLWETLPHMEYCVIWGTWGYSGGLTLPTATLEVLLNEALPAAVQRTLEKGGLCTFMPGVDEAVRDAVLQKIAELQPAGPSSATH